MVAVVQESLCSVLGQSGLSFEVGLILLADFLLLLVGRYRYRWLPAALILSFLFSSLIFEMSIITNE